MAFILRYHSLKIMLDWCSGLSSNEVLWLQFQDACSSAAAVKNHQKHFSQHSERSLLEYRKQLLAVKPLFPHLIYYHVFPRAPAACFPDFKEITRISIDVFKLFLWLLVIHGFRDSPTWPWIQEDIWFENVPVQQLQSSLYIFTYPRLRFD